MIKYKKPLWLIFLICSSILALAALVFLVFSFVDRSVTLISGGVAGAVIVGCGFSVFYALSSLKLLPQTNIPTDQGSRAERQKAAQALQAAKSRLDRSFSRCLAILVLVLAGVFFLSFYLEAQTTASIPQSTVHSGVFYVRGKVISIDGGAYRGIQTVEDVPVGDQLVTVEITRGEHKGERYQLENNLSYLYGTVLKEGDPVTVSFSITDGEIDGILLQDYDRTVPLAIVVLAFLFITAFVGGKVGMKSLLGLALTILCVFAVLVPLLLGGWETLPVILGLCAFVTVVEFVILDGVNRKTLVAILGTISGVVLAALFGELACGILRINGFSMYTVDSTVEALLQIKQGQPPLASLQIGDLLVGGILIAALGAVNDVAMSISSSMNELISVNPNLSRKELFRSGMNIGRDMVGTMTNTLILALVGSSLVIIIYLCSLEPSFPQLMSSAFFSVEMVQMLASSAGVILAVPLSVFFGMLFFVRKKGS